MFLNKLERLEAKKSIQTGFIHQKEAISIYENLCFSLALFRTRTGDKIEEGKEILKRLFHFFLKGFPLYLHEYPNSSSSSYQIRCAVPIYWILQHYSHIIEVPLKKRAREIYEILIDQEEDTLSLIYQILLSALKQKNLPIYLPQFSHEWGLLLLAYQILDEKPNWILKKALDYWHPELMTFSGEPLQEYQRKAQPDLTLYDLFMSEHQQQTSLRIQQDHPIHLQGSLIFPFKKRLPLTIPETFRIGKNNQDWSAKGFHLFRYLWGNANQVRSLVCQKNLTLHEKDDQLLFSYPKELPNEKERMELTFYTTYDPSVQLFVNKRRETVFYFGEIIEIQTPEKTIKLSFSLEKGEGKFMGHISRGNRPAQIAINQPEDFSSYDWKIGLRSIHRSEEIVIGLRIL